MESSVISPSTVACLSVLGLESVGGIVTNVFILSVTLHGLYKGQNMSTSDKILTALCASNVCYSVTTTVNIYRGMLLNDIYTISKCVYILYGIMMYSVTSSSWLTACLCLFYFFKILNFRWDFLSWVKMKINALVPWLILVSEVVSVCSSVSCMLPNVIQKASSNDLIRNVSSNETSGIQKIRLSLMNLVLLNNCLPLLSGIVTTLITAGYLNMHGRRIRKNIGTLGSSSMKAHQTATNTMIRLLIFYAILHLALIIFCFDFFPKYSLGYWITMIILFSFSPVQAILLIFGNPKLRVACVRITCNLTHLLGLSRCHTSENEFVLSVSPI